MLVPPDWQWRGRPERAHGRGTATQSSPGSHRRRDRGVYIDRPDPRARHRGQSMQLRPGSTLAFLALLTGGTAFAADQTVPGAGNATAAATAAGSPRVAQAERFLVEQAERLRDRAIRAATLATPANPRVCIRHRIGLASAAARDAVIGKLLAAGLVTADDGAGFPGGLRAGIFPPALAEGSACPQLPQPFRSAPGST